MRFHLAIPFALAASCFLPASEPQFVRGDSDGSLSLEITDPIRVLLYLFSGGEAPGCLDAADADDSGQLQLTDAVWVLSFLFQGGPGPAAPYPACGFDLTPDELGCINAPCEESDWSLVAATFGVLETIAGKGEIDRDANDWLPEFEGGAATDAELSTPHNAMGDDAGYVYIADKDSHAIRKVTPQGLIFTAAGTNELGDGPDELGPATACALGEPNGLWVRGDGTVYVLDLGNEKVRRLHPDGKMDTFFRVPGLVVGRAIWVSPDETLAYVGSGSVLFRWTPGAGAVPFASDFLQLGNIHVDSAGTVFATDRSANRVFKLTSTGEKVPIAGNGSTADGGDGEPALETGLNGVRGIWVLASGGYFLATQAGNQVWYVDTSGIIHLFLDGAHDAHGGDGKPWDAPGPKVSEVRNVTMDPQGNLLVIEHDAGFIRRVLRR